MFWQRRRAFGPADGGRQDLGAPLVADAVGVRVRQADRIFVRRIADIKSPARAKAIRSPLLSFLKLFIDDGRTAWRISISPRRKRVDITAGHAVDKGGDRFGVRLLDRFRRRQFRGLTRVRTGAERFLSSDRHPRRTLLPRIAERVLEDRRPALIVNGRRRWPERLASPLWE